MAVDASARALPALDHLFSEVERRRGAASLAIHSPRKGDWQATTFREDDKHSYASGFGDTLADALVELLEDPQMGRDQ